MRPLVVLVLVVLVAVAPSCRMPLSRSATLSLSVPLITNSLSMGLLFQLVARTHIHTYTRQRDVPSHRGALWEEEEEGRRQAGGRGDGQRATNYPFISAVAAS